MRILIVTIIISLFAISACKESAPTESQLLTLYGSWQWLQTWGGFGGSSSTPASTGYTQKVVFLQKGIAQFYRNDTLRSEVFFSVYSAPGSTEVQFIHFMNDDIDQRIYYIGEDSLRLSDCLSDGFNSLYKRIH